MAPMSLRIKSQHLTMVCKAPRAAPMSTLQIRTPATLSFSPSAHGSISRALQMSLPSGPWHLLFPLPGSLPCFLQNITSSEKPSFYLFGFCPQTLFPPGILIVHGCSIVFLPCCLFRRLSAPQGRDLTLFPAVSPCLEQCLAHSGCFSVSEHTNNIPLRPAQLCSHLLSQESPRSLSAAIS